MRIKNVKLYKFDLPLIKKIKCKNKIVYSRKGFIIEFYDNYNNKGYGEISPLSGLHQETLDDVKHLFFKIKKHFIDVEINSIDFIFDFKNKINLPPSLDFGIDMGIINLLANNKKYNVCELFSNKYKNKIYVNGLVDEEDKIKIIRNIKEKCNQGYKYIKIKVGRTNLTNDIDRINNSINHITGDIKIILDANKSWSLSEAELFFKSVNKSKIEYIEEPLGDISLLYKFHEKTGINIGLDETLSEINIEKFNLKNIRVIVLKPDTIGSINKIFKIVELAKKNNIKIVISNSFNSDLELSFLAFLSAFISCSTEYAGFDTYKWFKYDILCQSLFNNKPEIDIPSLLINERNINWDLLENVE